MSDVGRSGDPTETLQMDWSYTPQASQQHYTSSFKEDDRERRGAAIWKQTSKKQDTAGDSWEDWLRTGVPGGIVLAAYAQGAAMKALID